MFPASGGRFSTTEPAGKPESYLLITGIISCQAFRPPGCQASGATVLITSLRTHSSSAHFKDQKTDFNIFECGKGARYDDVNNIKHEYAVINSIFLEHTRELGETLEDIAKDKSHVITGEQKCVYTAEQTPEVLTIIQNRAHN